MKKTAKIYIINIGGSIRNIKAFSKAQISKRLNISICNIIFLPKNSINCHNFEFMGKTSKNS